MRRNAARLLPGAGGPRGRAGVPSRARRAAIEGVKGTRPFTAGQIHLGVPFLGKGARPLYPSAPRAMPDMTQNDEIPRRRSFAIISHPDAGKTTLTEKLLLFGGAIQMAGAVKGRKAARHATSDWMRLEQQRGISVTSSVMQFPYRDCIVNLLDTPGHEDFSEDTYRTLTAVDSALMVIDCAKGVEE